MAAYLNVLIKVHPAGTRVALGNCLLYNFDTANKLPTTSVFTIQTGGKEIILLQEAKEGVIFASLLPNPKKMSWQD